MNLLARVKFFDRRLLASTGALSVLMLTQPVRADLIELTNGDHYRGTVISMSLTNVEFLSEIQGKVTLPRAKIAQITLHEVTAKPLAAKPAANAPLVLSGSSSAVPTANAPLILSGAGSTPTVGVPVAGAGVSGPASAVVDQMRQQGVDPKLIDQVQEKIFGKSSPEAAAKFNELMGGLMSGQVSIKDIQAQAQRAIDQIRAAKKELGPEAGEMLDGYLGILEKFVQDASTDNNVPVTPTKPLTK